MRTHSSAASTVNPMHRTRLAAIPHAHTDASCTATSPSPEPGYAELHCLSAFSFGRGASSATELFERARELGYAALAITDECTLAGIVRALEASEQTGLPLIVGSSFRLACGLRCVLLCEDLAGYQRLCQLITTARRRCDKGRYELQRGDVEDGDNTGLLTLWLPGTHPDPDEAQWLRARFPERTWLAVELHRDRDDDARLRQLLDFAAVHDLPCVASGDVHMHRRSRRALQDALTAIRLNTTLAEAGTRLFGNGERHLRSRHALAAIHPPALLAETLRVAARCRFNLRGVHYQYPRELVPAGHTPTSWLRALTAEGARQRWPQGLPEAIHARIEHELAIIARLRYEAFFLTVQDIVREARERGILCQGRGSAANSAVCYALGITAVNPEHHQLLFGRFISEERNEPPDIDVDFEHERREEIIQYVYGKYGRERAALAATVIRWQPRSAVRELAKVLGLSRDQQDALSHAFGRGQGGVDVDLRLREAGVDPESPLIRRLLWLLPQLIGLPRHLSQHVGGFVIADQPLWQLVPVENAAMAERSIIQWDKDDLEELKLLKVDVLALGMLSCLRRCLDSYTRLRGRPLELATIPAADRDTYDMLQRGDSIGVFQVESRAQMAMLPRLKPACFYDLVVQVAIVRPGPIQGGMVHPYLRRRSGAEKVDYPSAAVKGVLHRTLGVPIFQEQVMALAMVAAGFSEGEADQLRRSMAAWKRRGGLEKWRTRILDGMAANGYDADYAERIFEQIKGFGDYGFPESHAASFALLTYVSAWFKCHEPAIFFAALLDSLPMGFYAPAQLVAQARRDGVAVLPVDVQTSAAGSLLVPDAARDLTLRLGLDRVNGLGGEAIERLLAARVQAPFRDTGDLARRAGLDRRTLQALAQAGALRSLAGHRHRAAWAIAGTEAARSGLSLADDSAREARVTLRPPTLADDIHADYAGLGLSLKGHPLQLLRPRLRARGVLRAKDLEVHGHGQPVRVAGLVTTRQRPGTASGVTFVTLEDETGLVNLIVWPAIALRDRRALLESSLLGVRGTLQFAEGVRHVIAERLYNLSDRLPGLRTDSRDFQ